MNTKQLHIVYSCFWWHFVSNHLLIFSASFSPGMASQAFENAFLIDKQKSGLFDSPVITIGIAADLSGGTSVLGWQEVNSAQLAISQTNAAGGIDIGGITYTLALVTADSPCGDDSQAIIAAEALLNAGAKAVVGHTCSGTSLAAQPVYNAAGVVMISASSTDPMVTQQGYNTTFRTVTQDGTSPALLAAFYRMDKDSKEAPSWRLRIPRGAVKWVISIRILLLHWVGSSRAVDLPVPQGTFLPS